MNNSITKYVSTTLIVIAAAISSGCASGPQTLLSLNGQKSSGILVNETAGANGVEQTLISKSNNTIVVVSPQKRSQLGTSEDLWFNVVAINKSNRPVSLSVDDVSGFIGGEYVAAPSAEEMEEQRKAEVRKAQLWGFATMIAGAALVDNAGANTEQYLLDTTEFMINMSEEEGEVTDALVAKYEDVVLKEARIAPKGNHGGLVRFSPPNDGLWYYRPVSLSVDVGGDKHHFQFNVNAEINQTQ